MASLRENSSLKKLQLELQRFRQSRNISLDHVSRATKISHRFLVAIENEDFDKLPGGVFNTSYIRQYASAVGYEPGKLLAYYNSRMGADEEAPATVNGKSPRWSFSW